MSVAENVALWPDRRGRARPPSARAASTAALALVELDGFGERPPALLSGGQRQRVALARCLVTEPSLVLLDEPLANLDVHLRASMEDEFARFHARTGTTMVYITHDQAEAMALADRIAVMDHGACCSSRRRRSSIASPRTRRSRRSSARAWWCRPRSTRRRRRHAAASTSSACRCGMRCAPAQRPAPRARCLRARGPGARRARRAGARRAHRARDLPGRPLPPRGSRASPHPTVRLHLSAPEPFAPPPDDALRSSRSRRLGDSVVTMRLALHGGFGEKGRTCLGVAHGDFRVLLDAGVKTSARGARDYYPAIDAGGARLARCDRDHACARGSRRRARLVRRQRLRRPRADDRRDAPRDERRCSTAMPRRRARGGAPRIAVEPLAVGDVDSRSARCGSPPAARGTSPAASGCALDDGRARFGYCGDVVPASPVFAMDPMPPCDAIALDASYGDDDVPLAARAAEIARLDRRRTREASCCRRRYTAARRAACARAGAARARARHARGAAARSSTSATGCVAAALARPRRAARGGAATGSRARRAAAPPRCCVTTAWAWPVRRATPRAAPRADRPSDAVHGPRARRHARRGDARRRARRTGSACRRIRRVARTSRSRRASGARARARALVRPGVARAPRAAHPRPARRRRHRRHARAVTTAAPRILVCNDDGIGVAGPRAAGAAPRDGLSRRRRGRRAEPQVDGGESTSSRSTATSCSSRTASAATCATARRPIASSRR